jgi:hypothetical protein
MASIKIPFTVTKKSAVCVECDCVNWEGTMAVLNFIMKEEMNAAQHTGITGEVRLEVWYMVLCSGKQVFSLGITSPHTTFILPHHHHLFTFRRSLFGNNMPLDVEIVIHIIKKIAKLQL